MKRISHSVRLVRSETISDCFSIAGPLVDLIADAISCAMIVEIVVFPSPGGQ